MNDDHESTTVKIRHLDPKLGWLLPYRKYLTPGALWGALGALAVAIAYLINAQRDITQLKESVTQANHSVGELRQQMDLLHKIDTQLQVMSSKVDTIADEEERQREWRERIESVAEETPHARRRH